ncbi:MAG TPA: GNAT family N-acetyltransferase [Anaerolineaceae bacterium]|nr:GNAT family N-acetyltransferase [Anaerolineaceae bacterium]
MNDLEFHPLTPERWDDFETLFGNRGSFSSCWCMWWRMSSAEWNTAGEDARKQAMREIVESRRVPGILAYQNDRVVGWCSVGPRADFYRIQRSRTLVALDDLPTWSVNCFVVVKEARGKGMMADLLRAAVAYAVEQGAQRVEGYPHPDREGHQSPGNLYQGTISTFRQVGFEEVEAEVNGKPVRRFIYQP